MAATPVYVQQPVFDEVLSHSAKTVAVTGTAVPLSSTSVPCIEVLIQVKENNTHKIYVGGASVPNDGSAGILLAVPIAGTTPSSIPLSARNLSQVYINGTAGEGVNFIYW